MEQEAGESHRLAMRIYHKSATALFAASAILLASPALLAESPARDATAETSREPAAAARNKHQKLCDQLGLYVGSRYEFMLTGNDEVHYWEIRSLGANGWIQVRDSRYLVTWVNLSQIIAISKISSSPASEARPKKANRER